MSGIDCPVCGREHESPACRKEDDWPPDPSDHAEEARALRETLRKFLSGTGHWSGCPVVWRNADECSPLCEEVRAHFGITYPVNPYRRRRKAGLLGGGERGER